jgi:TELO2-interacting protein 1
VCVRLSKLALGKATPDQLVEAIQSVLDTLNGVELDNKLADYVFFPLSYVIRDTNLPSKPLALAVQCLRKLIEGWDGTDKELVKQLLVFFTIQLKKDNPDVLLAVIPCIEALLKRGHLAEIDAPVFGQLIDTFLTKIKDATVDIQLVASSALYATVSVLDNERCRMFLPGIVSQLSNILRGHKAYRVIVKSLQILSLIIGKAFNEAEVSWKRGTASQLLLALSNIVHLKYYDRSEVREGLANLCFTVLDQKLENCQPLMLETLCTISSQDTTIRERIQEADTNVLLELTHKWLIALPRKLQSDEMVYDRHISLICEACQMLPENRELMETMINSIEDSASTILASKKTIIDTDFEFDTPNLRSLRKLVFTAQTLLEPQMYQVASRARDIAPMWVLARSLNHQVSGEILEMTLTNSIDVLSEDVEDWRISALALELLTLVAKQEKEEFKTSLVDTLFPVVKLLGSKDTTLKQCAVMCLDSISKSCGYENPGEMIVQNVDYLVNAVALKFNTFDVDPQAAQVLVMMLELSGPSLIPYLDDLVDSIFGALAAYHGYPRLVEVLFTALASIVRHGSSPASMLMDRPRIEHIKRPSKWTSLEDIPNILKKQEREIETPAEVAKEEKTKVYTMVQSVLKLSQHYLTHQEPYLRQKLLDLVAVGCSSLSRNEDEFLPLVNDIWPVVLKRLYDEEAVVTIAAMKALSQIFIGAGDFVSSRVEDEWPAIRKLYRQVQAKAALERGGRGSFAYAERLLDSMINMLINLMLYVRVTAEIEDDLFELLGSMAKSRDDVRDALDILNSDALWLINEAPNYKDPPNGLKSISIP